ncbi:helix-turn-helix domain-containing protein [Streptomyces griseoluteus]|uniref:helix-turn-helix domain-containing protein n=1 Tax=Streptomyces griseoluteus TaxID=29306 RepID=UPI0037F9B10F
MNPARDTVSPLARASGETQHETPVIPLRPGMTAPPKKAPASEEDVARRRTEALRLKRDGVSLREIGKRLGVSKDTARRDIQAAEEAEAAATGETEAETSNATGETAVDTSETPDRTGCDTDDEPSDGESEASGRGRDGTETVVLVVDDTLRRALAVLRTPLGRPDTPRENAQAARAAIRVVADSLTDRGVTP